jgi:hypothetical protein
MNVYPLPNGDIELGDYPYRIMEDWCNIVWIINEKCNLRCPYCVTGLKRAVGSNVTIADKLGVDKVVENFAKIRKANNMNLYLTITGGEPTLAANFIELCQKLVANDFVIELQTNLVSNNVMDFINNVGPDGVAQIMASYHGYLLDAKMPWHDKYIKNYCAAFEAGHTPVLKIVATPEEIEAGLVEKVRKLKTEIPEGSPILVWVYIKWMPKAPNNPGGAYPYSYTDNEKEILDEITEYRIFTQKMYRDGAGFFTGIKCDAGRGFVVAYRDGIVVRCFPMGRSCIIGSLAEGKIDMNECPKECTMKYCSTTFWPLWYAIDPWSHMPEGLPYGEQDGYFNRFGPKCEIKRIDE